jgi:hypothetical protein
MFHLPVRGVLLNGTALPVMTYRAAELLDRMMPQDVAPVDTERLLRARLGRVVDANVAGGAPVDPTQSWQEHLPELKIHALYRQEGLGIGCAIEQLDPIGPLILAPLTLQVLLERR